MKSYLVPHKSVTGNVLLRPYCLSPGFIEPYVNGLRHRLTAKTTNTKGTIETETGRQTCGHEDSWSILAELELWSQKWTLTYSYKSLIISCIISLLNRKYSNRLDLVIQRNTTIKNEITKIKTMLCWDPLLSIAPSSSSSWVQVVCTPWGREFNHVLWFSVMGQWFTEPFLYTE